MSSKSTPDRTFAPFGSASVLAAVCACLSGAVFAESPTKVDFNFQVRPILADRCFTCHGPDERARKAKLRLDIRDQALAVRDPAAGTRAVAPSQPDQSEMVRRIFSADPEEVMPPPASNLSLTPAEKDLLRRWIAEGAEYQQHWAFVPLKEPPVPAPPASDRPQNPIDAFAFERLQQEGLKPAPEATRETLIRRLSLDLRGLPPSLEEIDSFLNDSRPDAYERLVDALLASPAYGEHQAKSWLDLARFADTYGYQADVDRDLSPWRDWVIQAFNENLPYDEFILWQLAGDLLPNATREQMLATAFNRLHRQTNEGGSIDEEFRAEYVADRVETAGTAFLGLTLGCARCHDHKYDPVTQKDFYRMSAFFNNIDESGLYSHFTQATPSPTLLLYQAGEENKHRAAREQLRNAEASALKSTEEAQDRFSAWADGKPSIPVPKPVALYHFDESIGNKTFNALDTNYVATLVDAPQIIEGHHGKALLFSGDNSAILKRSGAFDRTSSFTFSLWLKPGEMQKRAVVFHRSRAWSDSGSRGYELILEDGHPTFSLIHFWPGNAVKVRARASLPVGQWTHLAITYDGSSHADGIRLFVDGERLEVETVRDDLFKDILHRAEWGDADVGSIELTLAGRFRDSGFKNGAIDEFQIFDRRLTTSEVRGLAGGNPSPNGEELFEYYAQEIDPECVKIATELAAARQAENRLINDVPEIMVMKEMAQRRPTFLLKRGAYDAPGDPVEPGTPEGVMKFSPDLPPNRLGLARWMTDPQNPLTSRVAVNRFWRSHFGRGLVETEGDFGIQGKLPSHPALLDWLAWRFIHSGWDVKALHRLIVTSATYRQTSIAAPEVKAKDPENRWLAHGPKYRLEAEQIRDQALAISGLLSPRIGGPSVRPYQPAGLWEQAGTGKQYHQDKGEALYRRSLYTFWRRTAPPPSMLIFDAPTREVCIARRETRSTPLQALVLMNDPQFIEASRVLAEKLLLQHPDDLERGITDAFRLVTGRNPAPEELKIFQKFYRDQLREFEGDPTGAESFVSAGESSRATSVPAPRLAAATMVVNSLMNLDEFVTKR